jgi:hypothetical protein
MSTTVKKLNEFESFRDMASPPKDWESAMRALAAGAVDYDDIELLLDSCARLANKVQNAVLAATEAKTVGGMDVTASWGYLAGWYWEMWFRNGEGVVDVDGCFDLKMAAGLIHMGQVADMAADRPQPGEQFGGTRDREWVALNS